MRSNRKDVSVGSATPGTPAGPAASILGSCAPKTGAGSIWGSSQLQAGKPPESPGTIAVPGRRFKPFQPAEPAKTTNVQKRHLDNMSPLLLQAAMQAAEAWEQGTCMFGHDPETEESFFPRNRAQTEEDMKRKIAGNLETVEWIDWSKLQEKGKKQGEQEEVAGGATQATNQRRTLLASSWMQTAAQPRASQKDTLRKSKVRKLLRTMQNWPEEGFALALSSFSEQISTTLRVKAAEFAAIVAAHGQTAALLGVGAATVTQAGVSSEELSDSICSMLGYPFDLVVPGMLMQDMLEFVIASDDILNCQTVQLKLRDNWRRTLATARHGVDGQFPDDLLQILLAAYDDDGRGILSESSSSSSSGSGHQETDSTAASSSSEGWEASRAAEKGQQAQPTSLLQHDGHVAHGSDVVLGDDSGKQHRRDQDREGGGSGREVVVTRDANGRLLTANVLDIKSKRLLTSAEVADAHNLLDIWRARPSSDDSVAADCTAVYIVLDRGKFVQVMDYGPDGTVQFQDVTDTLAEALQQIEGEGQLPALPHHSSSPTAESFQSDLARIFIACTGVDAVKRMMVASARSRSRNPFPQHAANGTRNQSKTKKGPRAGRAKKSKEDDMDGGLLDDAEARERYALNVGRLPNGLETLHESRAPSAEAAHSRPGLPWGWGAGGERLNTSGAFEPDDLQQLRGALSSDDSGFQAWIPSGMAQEGVQEPLQTGTPWENPEFRGKSAGVRMKVESVPAWLAQGDMYLYNALHDKAGDRTGPGKKHGLWRYHGAEREDAEAASQLVMLPTADDGASAMEAPALRGVQRGAHPSAAPAVPLQWAAESSLKAMIGKHSEKIAQRVKGRCASPVRRPGMLGGVKQRDRKPKPCDTNSIRKQEKVPEAASTIHKGVPPYSAPVGGFLELCCKLSEEEGKWHLDPRLWLQGSTMVQAQRAAVADPSLGVQMLCLAGQTGHDHSRLFDHVFVSKDAQQYITDSWPAVGLPVRKAPLSCDMRSQLCRHMPAAKMNREPPAAASTPGLLVAGHDHLERSILESKGPCQVLALAPQQACHFAGTRLRRPPPSNDGLMTWPLSRQELRYVEQVSIAASITEDASRRVQQSTPAEAGLGHVVGLPLPMLAAAAGPEKVQQCSQLLQTRPRTASNVEAATAGMGTLAACKEGTGSDELEAKRAELNGQLRPPTSLSVVNRRPLLRLCQPSEGGQAAAWEHVADCPGSRVLEVALASKQLDRSLLRAARSPKQGGRTAGDGVVPPTRLGAKIM